MRIAPLQEKQASLAKEKISQKALYMCTLRRHLLQQKKKKKSTKKFTLHEEAAGGINDSTVNSIEQTYVFLFQTVT
jgi:hypothetical protein